MNGGADTYTQFGVTEYVFQKLDGSDGKEIRAYVMDMADEASGLELYQLMKNNAISTLSLQGYEESAAIINVFRTTSTYKLYARLDRFYVELDLRGFTDDTDARTTAKLFLDLYGSRL